MIRFLLPLALLLMWAGWAQEAQPADASQTEAIRIIQRLSQKCLDAKGYLIEGEMGLNVISARRTAAAKIKFALAISGPDKYALKLYEPVQSNLPLESSRIVISSPPPSAQRPPVALPDDRRPPGADIEKWVDGRARQAASAAALSREEYWRISDGQNLWLYLPKRKQYAVRAADRRNSNFETRQTLADYPEPGDRLGVYVGVGLGRMDSSENENDPAECILRLIIPTLGRLYPRAAAIDSQGEQDLKYAGQSRRWPTVRVLSNARVFSSEAAQRIQSLVELTLDPDALTVGRMVWTNVYDPVEVQVIAINFTRFSVGENLGHEAFTFVPPAGAKRVGCLGLPGQTGSALVGCPAPEFLAKDLSGKELRFSTLRGNPVLLAFMGSPGGLSGTGCPDCLTLPARLQKVDREYGKQGLVVLGVLSNGLDKTRQAVAEAGLTFRLFDGSAMYRNLPWDVIGPYVDWTPSVAAFRLNYYISTLFRVRYGPSVYLIDKDGIVVGFLRELSEESLRAMLGKAGF